MRVVPKGQKRAAAKAVPPPLELSTTINARRTDCFYSDRHDGAAASHLPNIEITAPTSDENSGAPRAKKGAGKKAGKEKKKGHGRSKSAPQQQHGCWAADAQDPCTLLHLDLLRPEIDESIWTSAAGWPMPNGGGNNNLLSVNAGLSNSKGPPCQHSPSMKSNITIPKRRYSVWRKDSLIDMDTPEFTEMDRRLRKSVPSSPQTVLALSGLFVCGMMLVLSGTIVLISHSSRELAFQMAGLGLLLLGFAALLVCALLQRKNISKWLTDMSGDLFALREAPVADTAVGRVPGSFIRQ